MSTGAVATYIWRCTTTASICTYSTANRVQVLHGMWDTGTDVGVILFSLRINISDISTDTITFTCGYTYDTSTTSDP